MARQGDSDPKEFFARSLGKAKLAGVVDFIEIVNVIMKASGAEAPKIVQQLEHAVPLDKIHKAAANLKSVLQTLERKSTAFRAFRRLLPTSNRCSIVPPRPQRAN